MQVFHYNYIKNKYGSKDKILRTDTVNLMHNIEAEHVYEDFYKDKELFDFSNYPENSKYYNDAGNLVVGNMKDEVCGVPIKGFVGLKSKKNVFMTEDNHESKRAEGINKNVVDDELKYEEYKRFCSIDQYET